MSPYYASLNNRIALLVAAVQRAKGNSIELLQLRSEVTRMNRQIQEPEMQTALSWLAKKEALLKIFAEHPEQRIPEMKFLTDREWIDIARNIDLDSETGIQLAPVQVRFVALQLATQEIQRALNEFVKANNGKIPTNPSDLISFSRGQLDDAIMERYRLLTIDDNRENFVNEPSAPATWRDRVARDSIKVDVVLIEKSVVNKQSETPWIVGPKTRITIPHKTVKLTFPPELKRALDSYEAQHPKTVPEDLADLKPYLTTSEQSAALEKFIKEWKEANTP